MQHRRRRVLVGPVPAQQYAAVLDFRLNPAFRQPQAGGFVKGGPVLRRPQFDVRMPGAHGMAQEPASVGFPGDGNLAPHQFVQGRGSDIHVAHEHQLGDFREPSVDRFFLIQRDRQPVALLGDFRAIGLDIDRQCVRAAHGDRTHIAAGGPQQIDFVRHADSHQ